MAEFWRQVFVYPLLDVLILFYNTIAFQNLGVAVIEMTVLLRLVLLPINVLAEKDTARYERLEQEVAGIQKAFKADEVMANDHIRALLKKRRISPWAKTLILFVQLLVLLVLYQVFLRGINAHLDHLADWAGRPLMPINTTFFGFELGRRNILWALAVGFYLFLEILYAQRKVARLLGRQDAVYRYAFPLFSIVVLSLLPMAKSLFVLTSMTFSLAVSSFRRLLWPTASTK